MLQWKIDVWTILNTCVFWPWKHFHWTTIVEGKEFWLLGTLLATKVVSGQVFLEALEFFWLLFSLVFLLFSKDIELILLSWYPHRWENRILKPFNFRTSYSHWSSISTLLKSFFLFLNNNALYWVSQRLFYWRFVVKHRY